MKKNLGKFGYAVIILLVINILVGVCMYFRLPDQIAIQWNGNEPSNVVGKIYIFLFPIIALLFCLIGKNLMRLVVFKWFKKTNETLVCYLNMFLQVMFLTCQIYIVLYAYGFRVTISLILIIEAIVGLIGGLKLRHIH